MMAEIGSPSQPGALGGQAPSGSSNSMSRSRKLEIRFPRSPPARGRRAAAGVAGWRRCHSPSGETAVGEGGLGGPVSETPRLPRRRLAGASSVTAPPGGSRPARRVDPATPPPLDRETRDRDVARSGRGDELQLREPEGAGDGPPRDVDELHAAVRDGDDAKEEDAAPEHEVVVAEAEPDRADAARSEGGDEDVEHDEGRRDRVEELRKPEQHRGERGRDREQDRRHERADEVDDHVLRGDALPVAGGGIDRGHGSTLPAARPGVPSESSGGTVQRNSPTSPATEGRPSRRARPAFSSRVSVLSSPLRVSNSTSNPRAAPVSSAPARLEAFANRTTRVAWKGQSDVARHPASRTGWGPRAPRRHPRSRRG